MDRQEIPEFFETPEDGCLMVLMEEIYRRDGVTHPGEIYHTTITTPPIDLSNYSSAIVTLNQQFRLCCNETFILNMLVTNDGGAHWATYDLRHDVGANNVTPEKFRHQEFNISDVGAGLPNVQIRFVLHGPHNYYWMIDDLKIIEGYNNDLKLDDTWLDFYVDDNTIQRHINYFPLSQIGGESESGGTIGEYAFSGSFLNNGIEDQEDLNLNVTILQNGNEVFNELGDPATLWPLEVDTVRLTSRFKSTDYGDYLVKFTGVPSGTDEVPLNHVAESRFTVTDSLFLRTDRTAEAGLNTGGYTNGNHAYDRVGTIYPIFKPCEINGITAYITGGPGEEHPIGSTYFAYHLLQLDPESGDYVERSAFEYVTLDSSMLRQWVNIPITKDGETEFLEPNSYAVVIEMIGEAGPGMAIGWDKDTKYEQATATYMYFDSTAAWFNPPKLGMIGFTINNTDGPDEAPVTFNVDMNKHIASGEFIPGTDFVDVSGSFNGWTNSEHMTDPEGDGIYTLTIQGAAINSVIEYKYRINANWDTSEFPNGGPNREYTVRYWNVLNNIYNNGLTAGIDQNSLVASFTVYPNPNSGSFAVVVTTTEPSDLEISLTNIQGQVLYHNHVANSINHMETIDQQLAKGVYFLTVKNRQEVNVRKVIVR